MREASPTASSILGSITLLWKSRKSSIFPSIWRTLHFQGEFSTRGFFLQKLTLATRLWGRFLLLRAQQQLAPGTKLKLFWLKLQEIWDQIARGIMLMFSPKVTMITTILITSTTATTILGIMIFTSPNGLGLLPAGQDWVWEPCRAKRFRLLQQIFSFLW